MTSHSFITPLTIRTWCISCSPNQSFEDLEKACATDNVNVSTFYVYRVESYKPSVPDMTVLYVTYLKSTTERLVAAWCQRLNVKPLSIHPKQHPLFVDERHQFAFKQCMKYYVRNGRRLLAKPNDPPSSNQENTDTHRTATEDGNVDCTSQPSVVDDTRMSDPVGDNRMSFDTCITPRPSIDK